MKKILLIHTRYRNIGGEDISFINELKFLSQHFEVENLVFSNDKLSFKDYIYLVTNNNKKSSKLLEKKIQKFQPDFIYVHNTWFKASLGIFRVISRSGLPAVLKLHNTRYNCTNSFLSKKHFRDSKICNSCGQRKDSFGIFNKYYKDSYIRSFLINNYGKKYMKLLRNSKIKILVLSEFHKSYLSKHGVNKNKIFVFPNYIKNINKENISDTQSKPVIYAGRISSEKGIFDLITAWKESGTNEKLIIAGNGPEKLDLEQKIANVDNISYIGEVSNEESINLIINSKCVVSATHLLEGQPTLFCEASSAGIPSIFPLSGGINSFFPEGSKLSFENGNLESLKKSIELLNDDSILKDEGLKNKTFIDEYLGSTFLVEKFVKILNE
jgi:glycosyltransferase involved in cell wall biosynthesis